MDLTANSSPEWALDPQLARDTVLIGDLALCRVLLMNDSNFPWLILVPRRLRIFELIDLDRSEQVQLMAEIASTSEALRALAPCDKLNIAAIGNVVSQLHVHIVARRRSDRAWPKPVWGVKPSAPYEKAQQRAFLESLRQSLKPEGLIVIDR